MLVLRSCTDSPQVLPASSIETFPTSADGVCNFNITEFDEDVDVKEGVFIAVKEEVDIGIKQEENPHIKSEPDEVSYVCVCLLLLDTFYQMTPISQGRVC
jgi:hypothetical protein